MNGKVSQEEISSDKEVLIKEGEARGSNSLDCLPEPNLQGGGGNFPSFHTTIVHLSMKSTRPPHRELDTAAKGSASGELCGV